VNTTEKYESLLNDIKPFYRLAVAFSGGIDSAFLLKRHWGVIIL
jgi:PP-loop superfamily ATP-utilizing enzyme